MNFAAISRSRRNKFQVNEWLCIVENTNHQGVTLDSETLYDLVQIIVGLGSLIAMFAIPMWILRDKDPQK